MEKQLTLATIREQNRYHVLEHLLANGQVVRGELAKACGVSLMTIKKVVDELLQKGLVVETKAGSEMGRKPLQLAFAPEYGCVVSLGLSSKTHIMGAVFHIDGRKLHWQKYPVGESYLESLEQVLAELKHKAECTGLQCVGAGISLPSVYNEAEDRLNSDLIGSFRRLQPKKLLRRFFGGVPVCIMQDVRAAVSVLFGGTAQDSLFYFYLGDGIGGAFINDGDILTGAVSVAGEIGQCLVECGGRQQILEQAVSVSSIGARLQEIGFDAGEGFKHLHENHQQAAAIIEDAATTAADTIVNLSWILNPARFVVESTEDFYAQRIVDIANSRIPAMEASAIANTFKAEFVSHGGQHALNGIFKLTREKWLHQQARTLTMEEM